MTVFINGRQTVHVDPRFRGGDKRVKEVISE
jgi:hypothetical protein